MRHLKHSWSMAATMLALAMSKQQPARCWEQESLQLAPQSPQRQLSRAVRVVLDRRPPLLPLIGLLTLDRRGTLQVLHTWRLSATQSSSSSPAQIAKHPNSQPLLIYSERIEVRFKSFLKACTERSVGLRKRNCEGSIWSYDPTRTIVV